MGLIRREIQRALSSNLLLSAFENKNFTTRESLNLNLPPRLGREWRVWRSQKKSKLLQNCDCALSQIVVTSYGMQ